MLAAGLARAGCSSKPSTAQGPALVHTTLVSRPNMPSIELAVRRHQPRREQVQPQPHVVGVREARQGRGGPVHPASPRRTPRTSSSPASAVSSVLARCRRRGRESCVSLICGLEGNQHVEAVPQRSHSARVGVASPAPSGSAVPRPHRTRTARSSWLTAPVRRLTGRSARRCTRAAGRRAAVPGVLLDHVHDDVAHLAGSPWTSTPGVEVLVGAPRGRGRPRGTEQAERFVDDASSGPPPN